MGSIHVTDAADEEKTSLCLFAALIGLLGLLQTCVKFVLHFTVSFVPCRFLPADHGQTFAPPLEATESIASAAFFSERLRACSCSCHVC